MKTEKNTSQPMIDEDEFGQRVAARLTEATETLPHDIRERLRFARAQAMLRRQQPQAAEEARVLPGATATLIGLGGRGHTGFWHRLGAFLPLLMLLAGLIALDQFNNDHLTRQLAELDTAILMDDLPPAAYADPGFAQFLKLRLDQKP